MNKSIKILVGYHKPSILFNNKFFLPIHIGRDVSTVISKDGNISEEDDKWLEENLIGDNTGENISFKNREYSELTGIYWAWKNYERIGNPDYIGFMHYRRFLVLDEYQYDKHEQTLKEKTFRYLHIDKIDSDDLQLYGYDEDNIQDYLSKYDLLLPLKSELKLLNIPNARYDYENSINNLQIKDYDLMIETINKLYPEYKKYTEEMQKTSRRYFYNIFIMKKEIFFDYCNFLFSITEELYNLIDVSNYNVNAKRTMGYLGEALFDCYMRRITDVNNIRYKELGVLNIENLFIDEEISIKPLIGYFNGKNYFIFYFFGIKFTIKK